MQSEVQLAEANSKEKLLPLDQYLKDCWAKKQTAIDLTAYKITHEELNKVIFGIHYEEPEYYWTIRYRSANRTFENLLSLLFRRDRKSF